MTKSIDNTLYLKEQKKLLWTLLYPDEPETLSLKAAEQLVASYSRIDSDVRNRLTLLLAALEAGTAFLNELGDIYEDYYDTLTKFWDDFEKLMEPQYLPEFQDELLALRKKSEELEGYGYWDYVDQVTENLFDLFPSPITQE
jgi:hypothetical protein